MKILPSLPPSGDFNPDLGVARKESQARVNLCGAEGERASRYLIILGGFFDGEDRVAPVSPRLSADTTDEAFFFAAKELQRLLMLFAQRPPFSFFLPCGPLQGVQAQPPGDFHHVSQLPVRSEIPLQGDFPALRTGEIGALVLPALGDAGAAKAVAASNGNRVSEILQAHGASGFLVQAFHRVLHGDRELPLSLSRIDCTADSAGG